MSQSHILVRNPPPRRNRWLEASILAAVLVILAFCWVVKTQGWLTPDYDSVQGKVLETRIVADHFSESQMGSSILYRLEARVQYAMPAEANVANHSQLQDRWLIASDPTSSRELLMMRQAKQSKTCSVYWLPHHPETVRCELE